MKDRSRIFSFSIGVVGFSFVTLGSMVIPSNSLGPDHPSVPDCRPGPGKSVADVLNVRTSPFGGAVIDRLYKGTAVMVIGCSGNWGKLDDGRWVHTDYLVSHPVGDAAGK